MRDRIKTNKRLLHSQSLLSLAVGTSPDTILVTRLSDGCILDVNEGFVRNTGYSREEAVGRSTRELNIWTNDESRESFVLVLRDKGVCRNFENSFRTRDGRIIAGLVSAQIIDIEGEACVFAVSRDISDLKYAQEALFKSEEHFRSVVESLAEALIITDEHGVTRYANARVTELTGYEPSHLLGNRAHESLMHPDDWPDMRKRDEQRLQGHSETYEVRVFRRNGSWFWAEVHAAPCRNAAGEIIGTLGALTDISGRRHLEAQLRQSQKMEAVGQLAAGVAHNFNNMLQVIIGSLEAALPDVAGDVKSLLVDAEKSSRRAAEIVSQLVLFAHHGRRRNFEPLDVSRVLADTVDLCRRSFDRSITLSLRPSGITATVNGDSGQLQQVFLNICLNARDALKGVEGRNPAIQIEVAASVSGDGDDQSVEIAIIDNGVGMSQDVRDQAFQPFFSTKEIDQGTGLGLATAYAIIDQHKGSIECESEVGVGTTFTIRLPAADVIVDTDLGVPTQATPSGEETVLVIDDEEGIRHSIGACLTRLGYRVLLAEDGRAGLDLFKQTRIIDLVLLDLSMPQMSGREVLQALRALDPDVKVVLFTGYPLSQAEEGTVAAVLNKPVKFDDIARCIRGCLDSTPQERPWRAEKD